MARLDVLDPTIVARTAVRHVGDVGSAVLANRRFLELTDLPPGNADLVRAVDRMALCDRKARGDEPE